MSGKAWTQEEEAQLREIYFDTPMEELMEILGRTYGSILAKGNKLGLRRKIKSPAQVRAECSKRGYKLQLKVEYPKQQDPGSITKRSSSPYLWIKIARPDKWRQLQSYVWERIFGPIPRGYQVSFKDGDTTNCSPDNLFLRNKAIHITEYSINNYPKDLSKAIRAVSKLNKKIKEYEKN